MKSSVALIGFMGVGKTGAGEMLAERLGKRFVELDCLIEQKAGKPVRRIFEDEGEIAFRELEIEAVKEISVCPDQVIACGGGVVLNWINVDRLRGEAVLVWLTASATVILARTAPDRKVRPLLKDVRGEAEVHSLLRFRRPFYQRAADVRVDTSKLDITQVVDRIVRRLKAYESSHS
jgi:shikimate kinase